MGLGAGAAGACCGRGQLDAVRSPAGLGGGGGGSSHAADRPVPSANRCSPLFQAVELTAFKSSGNISFFVFNLFYANTAFSDCIVEHRPEGGEQVMLAQT